MRTMVLEDFTEKTLLTDLHPDTKAKLESEGVQELLPV
jgi:hypothetical protein